MTAPSTPEQTVPAGRSRPAKAQTRARRAMRERGEAFREFLADAFRANETKRTKAREARPEKPVPAVQRRIIPLVEHSYPNRADRRHTLSSTGAVINVPKDKQAPALNETYRKPVVP